MASNNITRTIVQAKAYAFVLKGLGEDGRPDFEKTEEVEFLTTAPSKGEAFRALKAAGVKCSKDMTTFEVLNAQVYALSLEEFLAHAVPVERKRNGEVSGIAKDEPESTE